MFVSFVLLFVCSSVSRRLRSIRDECCRQHICVHLNTCESHQWSSLRNWKICFSFSTAIRWRQSLAHSYIAIHSFIGLDHLLLQHGAHHRQWMKRFIFISFNNNEHDERRLMVCVRLKTFCKQKYWNWNKSVATRIECQCSFNRFEFRNCIRSNWMCTAQTNIEAIDSVLCSQSVHDAHIYPLQRRITHPHAADHAKRLLCNF